MGSPKYDLSWSDFVKAAKGSLYTFLGAFGALLLPLADEVKEGHLGFNVFLLAVASAMLSALGNLFYRFFTDTTN